MNFSGYIPLQRGLVEHTMDGRLSNNEALVFVWLLMLADRKTGSYTINGPTLRTFLPGLSRSAAQDALEALERKQYIYRDVKPRSAVAYRYWVAGFRPTDGAFKHLQLDLTEVFATNDTSRLRYVKEPPETPLPIPPATQPATPNNNKKEKEKETHKENPLCSSDENAQTSASGAQRVSTVGRTSGEASAPQCAPTAGQLPPGYELRDGNEGIGVYTPLGTKVHERLVPSLYDGSFR